MEMRFDPKNERRHTSNESRAKFKTFRDSIHDGKAGIPEMRTALAGGLINPEQYKKLLTDWTFGQEGLNVALAEGLIGEKEFDRLSNDYISSLDRRRI